jgi:hypothetical protein
VTAQEGRPTLVAARLRIRLTLNQVEIFLNGERLALHPRDRSRSGKRIKIDAHFPDASIAYYEATPQQLLSQSRFIHPDLSQLVVELLNADVYGNIRRVQGLIRSAGKETHRAGREGALPRIVGAITETRRVGKVRVGLGPPWRQRRWCVLPDVIEDRGLQKVLSIRTILRSGHRLPRVPDGAPLMQGNRRRYPFGQSGLRCGSGMLTPKSQDHLGSGSERVTRTILALVPRDFSGQLCCPLVSFRLRAAHGAAVLRPAFAARRADCSARRAHARVRLGRAQRTRNHHAEDLGRPCQRRQR